MPERERFGDFLLHERLAVGGMGELYLATRAERRGPPFALKIMSRSYKDHPEFVSMFQDEARIGMQLKHSNIVGVQETGIAEQTAYIVMEYVHGENLRNVLRALDRRGEKIPPALSVKFAIDVLRGLDYAHHAADDNGKAFNLVHRDLSPDNILVSYEGEVKLLDFGIAKAAGRSTTTQVGVVKGKPMYMSPEHAMGWPVDARSDLFSAAVVLRELLTGERRFPDDDKRWESARKWKPTSILAKVPGIPPELDAVLMRALEAELSRRTASADELATELTKIARSGALPRAKESLPALLKRLFPEASARKFDSSDVTLMQAPRWDRERADDGPIDVSIEIPTDTKGTVNLATMAAAAPGFNAGPGGSAPVGALDAKDLRNMGFGEEPTSPGRPPPRSPIGAVVPQGATRLDDLDATAPGVRPMQAPDFDPTAPQGRLFPEDRVTAPSWRPVLNDRRTALLALAGAALVPVGAVSVFGLWRLIFPAGRAPIAVTTPTPTPTPVRRPTPRPTPRKKPTPVKKKTVPRRRTK